MIWKVVLDLARVLFWAALGWLFANLTGRSGRTREISENQIEFALDRLAILSGVFVFGFLIWVPLRNLAGNWADRWDLVILVGFGVCALGMLVSLPGTIFVTADGLEQGYWFRKNKRIQWKEIVEINVTKKGGSVKITGKSGTRIDYFAGLGDRSRFLLEIKKRCGDDLPPDFPREPIETPPQVAAHPENPVK